MLNLKEYREKPASLADYLPWALLVRPGVVLNKDGSFQRSFRFRGPDLESSTEQELVAVSGRLNNVLRRHGSGWALFFEADRHEAQHYPASDWPDPVSWLVDQERRAAFEEQGSHFESSYTLTFVYLPPADDVSRAEQLLLEAPPDKRGIDYADYLASFISATDRALDLLTGIMPEMFALTDEETLTYLHSTISTRRHRVTAPDIPAYLDGILLDSPVTGGLEPMLGNHHLRTLTILGFPNTTTPGIFDDLNHLGLPYRWVTRFLPLDKTEANRALARYRRQWFSKRKSVAGIIKEVMTNQESALEDTDAANKAMDADAALQELGSDFVSFGHVTATVTVSDTDRKTVDEKVKAVERVINGRGFVTILETLNAVDAWLGSLPGHCYANIRQPLIHTMNLAHMVPLSAVWAGPKSNVHLDGPPLMLTKTAGATPFRFVTHMGDVGHMLVVGPTGAGKSVLLSLMAMQFRRYQAAQVYVFDKGASARAATLAMGGDFYDLGEDAELAFQPLANIDQDTVRSWASEWIAALLVNEKAVVTPEVKEAVWSALTSLSGAPCEERTLTGLSVLMQSNALKQALHPYTLEGPFGRLLDADNDRLALASVQCFEMEDLMHEASLVPPVLTYLFHRLETRFDGRPSLLILDEAWVFLDNPIFAGRIREWLKTLRKKNVSVIFATQSLSDIAGSAIAPVLIESCPTRVFLPNDRAMEPQERESYARFGLNDRQISIIATSQPKRDYYFQSSRGNRLFELGVGPIALAFCAASSQQDQALIKQVLTEHGRDAFASRYLNERNLQWAADLLGTYPGH
ncbi:MAG: conjugal transfer protein TrbE [Kiloniellales bacterium]|nr:conjugal transfer protein TrbE [Kiloniellales bacterium]